MRTKISEFSATPGDNTDIDGIDIAEGCAPSGINNAIREMMAQLKDFQTGSAGDPFNGAINGTVGATTPSTVVATQVDITAQGDLRLQDTTGGQYVALQAPSTVATSYTLTLPVDDGTAGQALITDGSGVLSWSSAASGDVYGPASATDNAVARFDSTTGKIIQNSAVTIADDGATVIAANSTSDGLRITQVGAGNALLVEDSTSPDATPFVIDQNGIVGIGTTTPQSTFSLTSGIGIQSTAAFSPQVVQRNKTNDTSAPYFISQKDRAGAIVQSGDGIGNIVFQAYDGASYLNTAYIQAYVDGTPGTNDMPGALRFGTTADGASSPTERMRIDNAGRVGIGGTPTAFTKFQILGTLPSSSTASRSVEITATIPSTSTAQGWGFYTTLSTQASAFTLADMTHYRAGQGTIGATSAVTNQYGFNADSTLTGATNNFGFFSNIASGTGRWNFYAAGTADNYFAGNVGVGTTTPQVRLHVSTTDQSTSRLRLQNTGSGGTTFDIVSGNPAVSNAGLGFYDVTSAATRMYIDSSGNVGIGIINGSSKLEVAGTGANNAGAKATYEGTIKINEAGSFTLQATGGLEFKGSVFGAGYGSKIFSTDAGDLLFGNRANSATWSERMRIDNSGNLLVGTTSQIIGGLFSVLSPATAGSFRISASAGAGIVLDVSRTAASGDMVYFRTGSTDLAGFISCPTSVTTTYNSVSDYRLKENVAPMTGALAKVAALKPVTYTWKTDGLQGQGFIAHELQDVVPDCVTGKKDALDKDGKPKYQGVDTSFLVATLVAAIQEQQAMITQLQADVAALKGN